MKNLLFTLCAALLLQSGIVKSQNINVTLAAQLSYASQGLANIGGWKSPVDGKEYALVGAQDGLSIVDVTTPSNPVQIVQIPGPSSIWREVKTVGNYAYITTEDGTIGLQIVELTNLPATNLAVTTWKPEIGIDSLETIHSLHADNGKVYLYGSNVGNGGCIIADVSSAPMSPVYLGSYDQKYVHDGYVRNDTLYAAHIYDGEVAVVNVSNPANPVVLATFNTPDQFTHNTWLSADSKTCFTTDELQSSSPLASFDISDLGNISETDRIQSNPGGGATVHNTHIVKKNGVDYAVTSWYKDGITIVDASRPNNLVQVGNYDTSPLSGGGYNGCWGVYPFLPSGTIVASDMQDGLFVLTPNYVRACYLEGTVTNCNNNNPLNGVTVQMQITNPNSSSHIDITDAQGNYAAGVAAPGTYQVIYSKPGYMNDTLTVSLSAGNVTLQNGQLCPLPKFTLTGKIYDNSTSLGIPNANVRIQDTTLTFRWDTITDANGNFTIPNMISGTFEVAAGKWGYITKCLGSQIINTSTAPITIGLDKGIYDDFTWDWGWTVSGNAATGKWERDEPLGTDMGGGLFFNPEYDVTTDCSVEAYITGNKGVTIDDDILEGNITALTSPAFDLSGYTNPRLFCSLWQVLLMDMNSSPDDTIKIMLSNGSTTATLAAYTSSNWMGQWAGISKNISTYLTPTSTMNLMVRVSDNDALDDVFIEVGFDEFYINEMNSVDNIENNNANVLLYPNPFSNRASLVITHPEYSGHITNMELTIYDLVGKRVDMSAMRNADGFLLDKGNLTPGIYFYKLTDNTRLIATGKLGIE